MLKQSSFIPGVRHAALAIIVAALSTVGSAAFASSRTAEATAAPAGLAATRTARASATAAPAPARRHLSIENEGDSPNGVTVAQVLQAAAPAAALAASGAAATQAAPSHGFGDTLRNLANDLLGIQYRFGGNTEDGLDCSGLVRLVWQRLGLGTLPRTAANMAAAGLPIAKSDLAPGDLVFFNTLGRSFSHVGVYLGDGRFLHASSSLRRVTLNSLSERYYTERFDGARRVVR